MSEKEFYTLGNLGKMIDKRSHSQSISIDRARWETAWFVNPKCLDKKALNTGL